MNVFNNRNIIAPSKKELWGGLAFFVAYTLVFPIVLGFCVPYFSQDSLRANFLYNITVSVCSFLTGLLLFRNFLFRSRAPFGLLLNAAVFGILGARGLELLWALVLSFFATLLPEVPSNMNQELVESLLTSYTGYMLADVVLLAPFIEELLFRGVIFAPLCKKNPLLAYIVSMGAFALLHVLSYIGMQHWSILLFSFLQYLPAGFVLCWSYQRTGSIWAPIIVHGLINLLSSVPFLF